MRTISKAKDGLISVLEHYQAVLFFIVFFLKRKRIYVQAAERLVRIAARYDVSVIYLPVIPARHRCA